MAFAKAWLERHNIESQTVDVHSHIDSSLSYEENIKNLKQMLGMGGRSSKKATRNLSAAECDVAVGNYEAGFDHESTREACECGEPNACDDMRREKGARAVKTTIKPKSKPKAAATPKFTTVEDAEQWLKAKYKEHGGRWKFQATQEYKEVHPHLLDLYGKRNRQIEKERKQVNIIKNPHGTGYSIQFEKARNTYVGGGMMGGMATFETVAKAVKEAKQLGYEIMSKPKATPSTTKKAPPKPTPTPAQIMTHGYGYKPAPPIAPPAPLAAAAPNPLVMFGAGTVQTVTKPKRKTAAKKPAKKKTAAKTTKAKPKAAPKTKSKKKTAAGTEYKLTATQKKRLAANGRVTIKRGGKFVTITR